MNSSLNLVTQLTKIVQILLQAGFFLFSVFSWKLESKQNQFFQQVGGLLARNISVFCLQRVTLYPMTMPSLIDFYNRIFTYMLLLFAL